MENSLKGFIEILIFLNAYFLIVSIEKNSLKLYKKKFISSQRTHFLSPNFIIRHWIKKKVSFCAFPELNELKAYIIFNFFFTQKKRWWQRGKFNKLFHSLSVDSFYFHHPLIINFTYILIKAIFFCAEFARKGNWRWKWPKRVVTVKWQSPTAASA